MFLTKIDLAPERRLARKYLGSPQAMHAVVMSATGGHDGNGPGRVLWRVDRGMTTALYILSPLEPDCSSQRRGRPAPRRGPWITPYSSPRWMPGSCGPSASRRTRPTRLLGAQERADSATDT